MNALQHRTMCALLTYNVVIAPPGEDRLGKVQGYPPAPSATRIHEVPYIVGTFSGVGRISPSCELAPAN